MGFLKRLIGSKAAKADPLAVYTGLRGIPLGEQGGPTDPFEGTQIIAVLLDWGQPGGSATIAAMADGATSLYTSTGGGVIGGGFHAPVREAHRRLMHAAQDHLADPTRNRMIDGQLLIVLHARALVAGRGPAIDPFRIGEQPARIGDLFGRENIGNGEEHPRKKMTS